LHSCRGPREEYAAKYRLDPTKNWIALLPGSRRKEVQLNLPEMLRAAAILSSQTRCEFVIPIASTVDAAYVRNFLQNPMQQNRKAKVTLVEDARDALHHARASVVASGTATVQAAVIGNPFVVVYRVSPLTFTLAKRLIRYPAEIPAEVDRDGNLPIAMVNLIASRRIVPELLQSRFTAENIVDALTPLLADGPQRDRMMADLAEANRKLLPASGSSSISQVCEAVQALLNRNRSASGQISTMSV